MDGIRKKKKHNINEEKGKESQTQRLERLRRDYCVKF